MWTYAQPEEPGYSAKAAAESFGSALEGCRKLIATSSATPRTAATAPSRSSAPSADRSACAAGAAGLGCGSGAEGPVLDWALDWAGSRAPVPVAESRPAGFVVMLVERTPRPDLADRACRATGQQQD